jgi:hypothetical protein
MIAFGSVIHKDGTVVLGEVHIAGADLHWLNPPSLKSRKFLAYGATRAAPGV